MSNENINGNSEANDISTAEQELIAAQKQLDEARTKLEEIKREGASSQEAANNTVSTTADAQPSQPEQAPQSDPVPPPSPYETQPQPQQSNYYTAYPAEGASQAQTPPPQQDSSQQNTGQQPYDQQPYDQQPYGQQPYQQGYSKQQVASKDHIAAGLLAIFLGGLGIHKFYLGYNTAGFIMLGVTILGSLLTLGIAAGVVWVIGVIEGIMYLVKSQSEFEQTYVYNKREWF